MNICVCVYTPISKLRERIGKKLIKLLTVFSLRRRMEVGE